MTKDQWSALTNAERAKAWESLTPELKAQLRTDGGLTKQLIGLEGWRVEVVTEAGETERFIVGRSSGWQPCHIALARGDSSGGHGCSQSYKHVKTLYRVR